MSWNAGALCCINDKRRRHKFGFISQHSARADIILVQEAHAKWEHRAHLDIWCHKHKYCYYINPPREASSTLGGLILVKEWFFEEFDVTHEIVVQHYIDMIIVRSKDGSSNILSTVVNVYLDSAENGAVRIAQMGMLLSLIHI